MTDARLTAAVTVPPALNGKQAAPAPPAGAADAPQSRAVETRPRVRPRTLILGVILVAIAAAAAYAVHYFSYADSHPSTDDAYVQGDTTIISAKVSGLVSRVLVKGYQHVRKGQPLVELDPVDAQIAAQ